MYDIVIIGGGPCGIACVVEAKNAGLEKILLLEKGDNHSQTIRKFYKDGKRVDKEYKGMDSRTKGAVVFFDGTKETTLNYFDALLDAGRFEAVFNVEVESVKKNGEYFEVTTSKSGYKAKNVVVAIGRMGKPNKPEYKIPPSIMNLVNFNLNNCNKGEKIIVVGGGNSAAEYACELGKYNEVTLCYRKEKFTRLNEINENAVFEAEKNNTLRLMLGVDITELSNADGKVCVHFTNGKNQIFDRAIYAIGGSTPVDFLSKCGIEMNGEDPVIDENYETNTKGLFVGGDIATKKGGSIVVALNNAHAIIDHIMKNK